MIDTIVLRINNIDKYPLLYAQFNDLSKRKGAVAAAYVSKDTVSVLENAAKPHYFFADTGRCIPMFVNSHLYIPSSDYRLSHRLNALHNNLEFNFSIPKYLFSTNVLQFISPYNQSPEFIYEMLLTFIDTFIRDTFLSEHPILEDVEIVRLDFCFNQMFSSKNDALDYLKETKKDISKISS